MGEHLEGDPREVYDAADAVLRFWFEEIGPEQQFAKDADVDRAIVERFGGWRDAVLASGAEGWRDDPDTLLAAIILLDQFSRNIHRGSARAFEADRLALSLTLDGIARGWDRTMAPERAVFLLMPLMHAEDAALQALSVKQFGMLGLQEQIMFARDHADVIARFGRFPSRNAALGRTSTPEEAAYLSQPGAGW